MKYNSKPLNWLYYQRDTHELHGTRCPKEITREITRRELAHAGNYLLPDVLGRGYQ